MIEHKDVPSKHITPAKDLILVRPRELPKGEVIEGGFVIEMEQNTSIVDRPTLGTIVSVGSEIDAYTVGEIVIWVSQDGVDVILEDGSFIFLQQKSILGTIK